jgi:hypothetical protein
MTRSRVAGDSAKVCLRLLRRASDRARDAYGSGGSGDCDDLTSPKPINVVGAATLIA